MKQVLAISMIVAAVAATTDYYGDDMSFLDGYGYTIPQKGDVYEEPHAPRYNRGNIRVPRRQEVVEVVDDRDSKEGTVEGKDKHVGRFYDWREYEPELYGGEDPYAHCVWPSNTEHLDTIEYQLMPAICKEELIWQKTLEDGTRQRFFVGPEFDTFFRSDMNVSFDTCSDTMPEGRKKVTHPVGLTAKMEFIPTKDTPYTGMFRGAKHVIMRISDVTQPDPEVAKTAPGHGVKLLRDGMASANWFAMFNLDGQDSFNFFANRWTTSPREPLDECARETIAKHVAAVTDHVGFLSIMEIAQFDQYGVEESEPNWPFQLDIEPYDVYGWTDKYQNDFQDQLAVIPYGTVVHKIFAYDMPPEMGGEERMIGALVSRSRLIDSLFGDNELYFQHHKMEDDIKARPHYFDWLQFWDNGRFNEEPLHNPAPMVRCPFSYLFEVANLI